MKLWKYIFFSEITETFEQGKPIKTPFIWALSAPDSDYDQVTDQLFLIEKVKEQYHQYEVDGIDYFRRIRAQLVLDYRQLTRTESDIFTIETTLKQVTDRLILGDWMSAKYELSQVSVAPPLDQDLYNQISNYITDYINNNY